MWLLYSGFRRRKNNWTVIDKINIVLAFIFNCCMMFLKRKRSDGGHDDVSRIKLTGLSIGSADMKTKYINVLVATTVLAGGAMLGGVVLNDASVTSVDATSAAIARKASSKSTVKKVTTGKKTESESKRSSNQVAVSHKPSASTPSVASASRRQHVVAATSARAQHNTASSQASSATAQTAQSSNQQVRRSSSSQAAAPAAHVTVSSSQQTSRTTQAAAQPHATRNTISFLGTTVPVIQGNMSITTAPSGNRAQTWGGQTRLSVTDGQSTHIIGHNTSSFGRIIGLGVGSAVSVTDGNGNTKVYHVTKTLNVTDQGKIQGTNTDVYNQIVNANQGEQIVLQTCISSTINRLVWAR